MTFVMHIFMHLAHYPTYLLCILQEYELTVEHHENGTPEGDVSEPEVEGPHDELLYKIDDNPPWYMCILLGFQVKT